MRDTIIIMARCELVKDRPILVTKCLTFREAILMAIQKNIQRIIIKSDSQLLVNLINGNNCVLKDIIKLVEDIRIPYGC